jgi:hypothetical protein
MYLKLSNLDKDINNGYVYRTLKSVYIDWLRANKPLDEIPTELAAPEQQLYGEEVVMPSTLSWLEVQIITLRQDHSLRKIATAYGMNYLKVYRAEKQARKKVELWQRKN